MTTTIPGPTTTITVTLPVETTTTTTTTTATTTTTTTTTETSCPTPDPTPAPTPDYGQCTDPTISWAYGLDGRTEWSWITNNQDDFPHGSSTTIGTLTDFICNRLRSPCNAPEETVERCYEAAAEVERSGLEGEAKSALWNELMT